MGRHWFSPRRRTTTVVAVTMFGIVPLATTGCGSTNRAEPGPAGAASPRSAAHAEGGSTAPAVHRSSDVLALLPDGPQKRRFILDCSGCHQLDASRMFADGAPRSEDEWRVIVQRMRQIGGASSASPLVSPDRDAAGTAAWLVEHLHAPPPPGAGVPVPEGAEITPFPFPHENDLPHDLAVEADGDVIVTGMFTHRMVRLDPSNGSWTDVPIPVGGANPRAIEIDAAGDWWVLLGGPGKIARYRAGDDEWDTWDIGMYGHSLRLDGHGRVWFNGHFTREPALIGWLDIASGRVRTVEIPYSPPPDIEHPMPYGLRASDDGTVWGTELWGGRIYEHDPGTRTTRVHKMPEPHSGPRRPGVDADGRLWIPEYAANRLTSYDPATAEFRSFEFPLPDVLPYVVDVDRRTGHVWVGTAAADVVYRFAPDSERFTAYPMPTEGALIRHLVIDEERGEVWAAYGAFPGAAPLIVRIRP